MGVCCASQNIEPNSMVDMSKIENPKPINLNKQSNYNKKEIKQIEEDNDIINDESFKKKESIKENNNNNNNNNNKNLSKNISNNENKNEIESKKEKIVFKQNNNDNSPVIAVKETNINSNLSENKIMSKQNSQNKKNEEKDKNEKKKKNKNKNEINIVFLGDTNTGKSCFVIKFVENVFEKLYIPTLGSEIKKKIVSYNTHKYQLNFFVTSGNDYKDDYTEYYNNADFFLVFYDITNKKSFDCIKNSIQKEIMPFFFAYKDGTSNIVLVGNKIDLENERNVKIEEVENYCKEKKLIYYEISIKTNKNINIMMNKLLKSFDQISYSE